MPSGLVNSGSGGGGTNSATVIRPTTGPPSVLTTDQNGDGAIDYTQHVLYGPFASGAWPAGYYIGGDDNSAADYGYAGLTMRPEAASGFMDGAANGQLYLTRFTAVAIGPVNHIDYNVLTAGASLTSSQCFFGIYDTGQALAANLTLLATSVDQSGIATSTGFKTANLAAALSLTVGNDYYVACVFNSSIPTNPVLSAAGSAQAVLWNNPAAANRMSWQNGQIGGPNTSLPGTISDIGYGTCQFTLLAGVRA